MYISAYRRRSLLLWTTVALARPVGVRARVRVRVRVRGQLGLGVRIRLLLGNELGVGVG